MQKHDRGTFKADGGLAASEKIAAELSEGMFYEGLEALARKDDGDMPVIGAQTRTRAEGFEGAARGGGCDPDEARSKDVLWNVARPRVHLP